jgi:hypothetical protein
VPFENAHDSLDFLEFMIVNIGIMGNPNEGLVDVLNWVNFLCAVLDHGLLVLLLYSMVQLLNLAVEQDHSHCLQGEDGRNTLNGNAISINADISQQVNVSH